MKQYEISLKVYFGRELWILDIEYDDEDMSILRAAPTDSGQPLPEFILDSEYFCKMVREALPKETIPARDWGKEMIECGHTEKDFV